MYRHVHKLYPWLTFDEIYMTFKCEKCLKSEPLTGEAYRTGKAEKEAVEFVNNHKDCEIRNEEAEMPKV